MSSRRPRTPPIRGGRLLGALLLAFATPLAAAPAIPPASAPSEYAVKAGFLYNFAKFVEWPQAAFDRLRAPLALCVFGADPFGGELDLAVRRKTAQGRPVVVRRLAGLGELAPCHVLFVGSAERERFAEVLDAVAGQSVLTVGEDDDFARAGGMISFVVRGTRVRFSIDVGATERAGLKLSSRLLDLAELKVGAADGRKRR